jgi:CheY-like chemotaxis protein
LREKPDLIFMDLSMTGALDGFEATRHIKAHPQTRHAVVVALTAMVAPGDREQALAAGCDSFIRKPYTRRELLSHLQERFPALALPLAISNRPPAPY